MSELPITPTDSEIPSKAAAINPAGLWRMSKVNTFILGAMALLLLTQIAYWPLHTAGYIWDDGGWLVHNHFAHHWRGLWNIWLNPKDSIQYYPLVFTAFVFEWHLWGANALGYHLLNIIFQGVDAILLWRVLVALNLRSAWVVAAIWAIHPVQVETVAWVAEQKSLLSAFFLFPAILAWIRFADLPGTRPRNGPFLTMREWRMYAMGLLCFTLALLSKTDACIIPIVLLFIVGWKRGRIYWRDVILLVPWLVLGVASALMTIYIEHGQAGAHGRVFQFTVAQHLIIAGKDLWFYPFKLFWPWPMMEVYPRWHINDLAAWQWIFPISAFAVPVVLLALSKKIGRGPFVAVAVYGLLIAPLLGFLAFYTEIYTFVADHYQYLACIGIIALVAESVTRMLNHATTPTKLAAESAISTSTLPTAVAERLMVRRHFMVVSIVILVLFALGSMTWAQCEIYTPPLEVWVHNLQCDPTNWLAMERIGAHEFDKGEIPAALRLFLRANQLSHGEDAVVNVDVADSLRALGHYRKAIPYYQRSLAIIPLQPPTISHLVQSYERVGNWRQAAIDVVRGIKLYPHSSALQEQLASMLVKAGRPQLAIPHYLIAIRYEPENTKALFGLAQALNVLGHWKQAIPYYQRALKASPGFGLGHFAYGAGLLKHGQPAAAAAEFRTVLKLGRQLRMRRHTFGRHLPPEPWRIQTHQELAIALRAMHHPRQAAQEDAIATMLLRRQRQGVAGKETGQGLGPVHVIGPVGKGH